MNLPASLVRASWLAGLMAACNPGGTALAPELPQVEAGPALVGAAEAALHLPLGTPLAAFSSRCACLDSTSEPDKRASPYANAFVESAGVYIRPTIKAVWVSNGQQHLVMTKADLGFAFDGVVDEVTRRLEVATGEDLAGQLTWSTTHTHSSYGAFTANDAFLLGADSFHREIFERLVQQLVDVALEAYAQRRPAALGFGLASHFDPTDAIYEDRRPTNDDLVLFPDVGPEQADKDPTMHLLRVDDAVSGDPIAVVFGFGFHPVTFWEDNPLVSADAIGPIEQEVAESFVDAPEPVVAMFLQGGAGDANVVGLGEGWRQTEAVGARVRDHVLRLRDETPTSTAPIRLESFVHAVPITTADIHVTRNGAVDWRYPRWDPAQADVHQPDNLIYNDDGSLRGDFDEWYTDYGAGFCGWGGLDLPIGGLPGVANEVDGACPEGQDCAYQNCLQVSLLKSLIQTYFYPPGESISLPARGMSQTLVAAARFGPIGVRSLDGTQGQDDVLLGFFPGEPVHFYAETWRRRAADELGLRHNAMIGYSMDHEGYLLVAEDWLRGGYEPDITFNGPLGAEWILENVLADAGGLLRSPELEPHDEARGPEVYDLPDFPNTPPDVTLTAGTRLGTDTDPASLWVPSGFTVDLTMPPSVPRVQGQVQVAWVGGDPAVDDPFVTLEHLDGAVWSPVTTLTGRVVSNDRPDFVLTTRPDPLFPADAVQTHSWWVVWQALGQGPDRAALPVGTYRLRIEGQSLQAPDDAFPWAGVPYSFATEPFNVVPAALTVQPTEAGFTAALVAPPSGFRMVDVDGDVTGNNPVRGPLTLTWELEDASLVEETVDAPDPVDGRTPLQPPAGGAIVALTVRDSAGNEGRWVAGSNPVR